MPAILLTLLTTLAGSSDILSGKAIANYLGLAIGLVGLVGETDEALSALHDDIKRMVAEGRDPTDEEFGMLKARSDAAHEGIQSARMPE